MRVTIDFDDEWVVGRDTCGRRTIPDLLDDYDDGELTLIPRERVLRILAEHGFTEEDSARDIQRVLAKSAMCGGFEAAEVFLWLGY